MGMFARTLVSPQAEPERRPARTGRGGVWFAWWVAACMVALAWSAYGQLQAQQRILEKSRALEAAVSRAREATQATNRQLVGVAALSQATARLDARLARLAALNAALKEEVLRLEQTVEALDGTVATLDGQALQSAEQLRLIAERSEALHRTLLRSHAVGQEVSAHLERMVTMQAEINADLAAMEAKTGFLDQLMGEE